MAKIVDQYSLEEPLGLEPYGCTDFLNISRAISGEAQPDRRPVPCQEPPQRCFWEPHLLPRRSHKRKYVTFWGSQGSEESRTPQFHPIREDAEDREQYVPGLRTLQRGNTLRLGQQWSPHTHRLYLDFATQSTTTWGSSCSPLQSSTVPKLFIWTCTRSKFFSVTQIRSKLPISPTVLTFRSLRTLPMISLTSSSLICWLLNFVKNRQRHTNRMFTL